MRGMKEKSVSNRRYVTSVSHRRSCGIGKKKCEYALLLAGLEDGGRSHRPKDGNGLWKLERSRKQILPWSL